MMLTKLEKKAIALIQGDIPLTERPYRELARRGGLDENTLLDTLRELDRRGVIRRFGATLRHQKSGFEANAMTAWVVDESRIEEVGRQMADFKEVSHCYRRNPTDGWPYNLYTMIHATDPAACRETARRMAAATGVAEYIQLFSQRELKKTSMVYFPAELQE